MVHRPLLCAVLASMIILVGCFVDKRDPLVRTVEDDAWVATYSVPSSIVGSPHIASTIDGYVIAVPLSRAIELIWIDQSGIESERARVDAGFLGLDDLRFESITLGDLTVSARSELVYICGGVLSYDLANDTVPAMIVVADRERLSTFDWYGPHRPEDDWQYEPGYLHPAQSIMLNANSQAVLFGTGPNGYLISVGARTILTFQPSADFGQFMAGFQERLVVVTDFRKQEGSVLEVVAHDSFSLAEIGGGSIQESDEFCYAQDVSAGPDGYWFVGNCGVSSFAPYVASTNRMGSQQLYRSLVLDRAFAPASIEAHWAGGAVIVGEASPGTMASEAFVVRVADDGGVTWQVALGNGEHERGVDAVATSDGGVLVLGVQGLAPTAELFVARLGATGESEWTEQ